MLLRPVEALEAIEPRLAPSRLPGSLTRLVAPDEFLGAGDELLLFFILLELPRPAFGAQNQIAPVRRRVVLQPAKRQIERPAGYAIQEIPIVRNDQECAAPGAEESLQPVEHTEIEMIRWLVQEQEIGVRKQSLGERDPRFLAAAERPHRLIHLLATEAEPHEDFIRAVLDVEATGDLKVKTQAFILLKELVEDVAARGLHCVFELSHPGQG